MKNSARKAISVLLTVLMLVSCVCLASAENGDEAAHKYKNVILMIGDGMGINSINSAKQIYSVSGELSMETMPVHGWSKTRSLTNSVTDSAAGGTALACGVRTYNGGIANFIFDPFALFMYPASLTDAAIQEGKATGVVTTDSTSGATPSAFSAHSVVRSFEKDISSDQLDSEIDLIWGAASDSVTESKCAKNGFTYINTASQMEALEAGSRSFGQFSYDDFSALTNDCDTPTISEMTLKAIELLSSDEDGFFLMVEGAQIDKKSHDNLMDEMAAQLMAFDDAVSVALDFAANDGDTLVVVTADHETGGITYNEADGTYYYTRDSHTGTDVPLFVSSPDAGFADGEAIKNKEVSQLISAAFDTDGKCVLPSVCHAIVKLFGGVAGC